MERKRKNNNSLTRYFRTKYENLLRKSKRNKNSSRRRDIRDYSIGRDRRDSTRRSKRDRRNNNYSRSSSSYSHGRLARHVRSNRDYYQFTVYDTKHKINSDTIVCKNFILYPSYCEYVNPRSRDEDYRYYTFDDGTKKPYNNVYFYNKISSRRR